MQLHLLLVLPSLLIPNEPSLPTFVSASLHGSQLTSILLDSLPIMVIKGTYIHFVYTKDLRKYLKHFEQICFIIRVLFCQESIDYYYNYTNNT